MRGKARFIVLVALTLATTGIVIPVTASASPSVKVLLEELSSPKGLAFAPNGDPVVGQGAFGPPAPVIQYHLHGRNKGEVTELTPPENVMDIAIGPDAAWGLGADQILYRAEFGGAPEAVADIAAYQETDPDPFDQEDNPTESNPYGLLALPDGDALVVDAAGNDLLRVTPDGDITTVARFDVEAVSTDHFPPEAGFPPTIDAESVPTAATLGHDGFVYVGELKGFPFRPGSSRIWRVDPDEEDALCSINDPDDDCEVAWEGLTAIQDIFFHRQTSTLYVYELAEDGVLAFEAGFETGEFPPAVLLEVKANKTTELAEGQLSQPGGIVVSNRGRVFVTDGIFGNGRLVLVRR
ncbi:MAG: ScyD/ScyE family protein [Actinomycetota bacterium]